MSRSFYPAEILNDLGEVDCLVVAGRYSRDSVFSLIFRSGFIHYAENEGQLKDIIFWLMGGSWAGSWS